MAETVREVPLSLQVFHSHNEYKAHRRNRTEQIYLRDLNAGLGREEKLYVKEYAFQRSSFHRHYARRFSAPLLSAPSAVPSRAATAPPPAGTSARVQSSGTLHSNFGTSSANTSAKKPQADGGKTRPASIQSPHASVFSASASLRHAAASTSASASTSSTPLAARMLGGLKEMSVSTRFQRVQRKFSIASMTEHGCLTAKGNSLANNIQKARKQLFGQKSSGPRSSQNVRDLLAKLDDEINRGDTMSVVEEDREGEIDKVDQKQTASDFDELDGAEVRDSTLKPQNNNDEHFEGMPIDEENIPSENEKIQHIVTDPRFRMPFIKLRASLKFAKQKSVSIEDGVPTTAEPVPETATETATVVLQDASKDETENEEETPTDTLLVQQTPSIFERVLSRTPYTEPLQVKIKSFLQEQKSFNRRFPKGQVTASSQSDRHRELVSRERQKKEQQKKEQEKKKEIVFEVLTKLGITDEHIWFHYQQ